MTEVRNKIDETDENVRKALDLSSALVPKDVVDRVTGKAPFGKFGDQIDKMGFENAYCKIWTRPELDVRSRILVTLGILIAQQSERQIKEHVRGALRQGFTLVELEEIILHASSYTGYPAASSARYAALEVLREEGKVE